MMSDWIAAGERIARAAQIRTIARGVTLVHDAFPGIAVSAEPDAIVLSGRGLFRRWINDAQLRAIGSLFR
jgi:hypothetical protein